MEIIYINLDHRIDRKKSIEHELAKTNSTIYRMPATYDILNGHHGCAQSHIRALEYAIKNKYNNVLIVEDDIEIDNNINEELNKIFTTLKNWDVILLGGSYINSKPFKNNIHKLITSTGCLGYIVKKNYMQKLLNNFKEALLKMKNEEKLKFQNTSNYAIDQYWFKLSRKDNWYIIQPPLVKHKQTRSDILNNSNKKCCVSRGNLNYPFYNIICKSTKHPNILVINGPVRTEQDIKEYMMYKAKGYYFVGMSSYMEFPFKLSNPKETPISKSFDIFSNKKYYENIIGWCYCQRNFKLPINIPTILLTESDLVNEQAISNYGKNIEKEYDFIYICLEGEWNSYNRNWQVAKQCINFMVNNYNLKVLVIGRINEKDCLKHNNITNLGRMAHKEFIQKLSSSRYIFIPNICDASPRVSAEAMILDIPVLENKNIIGGWHYINEKTGMQFNDFEDFKKVLPIFLKTKFEPKEYYYNNYNNNISQTKLAHFVNKLHQPFYNETPITNIFKNIHYFDNIELTCNIALYINKNANIKFNDKILHYLKLFIDTHSNWDVFVLHGDVIKENKNDYTYCNTLVSCKNVNIFAVNLLDCEYTNNDGIIDIKSSKNSFILDQNFWTMQKSINSNISINKTLINIKQDNFILDYKTIYYDGGCFKYENDKIIEYKNDKRFAVFELLDCGHFKDESRGYILKIENNKCFYTKYKDDPGRWIFLFDVYYLTNKWMYDMSNDYFIYKNNKWTEYKNGHVFAHFDEKSISNKEVILFDESRSLYVKLEINKCYYSYDTKWSFLQNGFLLCHKYLT